MTPEPFRIAIADEELDELRRRVARTRWPEPGDPRQGVGVDAVRALADRWVGEYDWRASEAQLNQWPQYTVTIDGQRIHYLHVRSPNADALPLVITHGWPGGVNEFVHVIEPLRADFHLVIPSLPGYGFSGPTHELGWGPARIARAWAALMAMLGYTRYGAQGGDWGSMVTNHLAALDPEHVVAVHLNLLMIGPPGNPDDFDDLSPREAAARESMRRHAAEGRGYQMIQGTRPQTLSYGLTDSPVGLLAWIAEKFDEWTDVPVAVDDLLTNVSIYWFRRTASSAARLYWESRHAPTPFPTLTQPLGVSCFPAEVMPRRRWVERAYDLVQWTEHDRGGHFPALEVPDLYVEDVRTFFTR